MTGRENISFIFYEILNINPFRLDNVCKSTCMANSGHGFENQLCVQLSYAAERRPARGRRIKFSLADTLAFYITCNVILLNKLCLADFVPNTENGKILQTKKKHLKSQHRRKF